MRSTKELPEGAVIAQVSASCPVHGRNTTTVLCEDEREYKALQLAVRDGFPNGMAAKNFTFPKNFPALSLIRKTV